MHGRVVLVTTHFHPSQNGVRWLSSIDAHARSDLEDQNAFLDLLACLSLQPTAELAEWYSGYWRGSRNRGQTAYRAPSSAPHRFKT